jgi:signal transduction histidine kinase
MVFVGARSVLLKRIQEIQVSIERMRRNERVEDSTGDELKEISDFCYLINDELDQQRSELEQKIAHAVRDLSATNARLASVNRELEGLNRAKSEFFSDISHELRTPLTNIKGAADFLARKRPGTDSEYIDIIKRNSDHLIKIVLDFLDYSKMEAGRFELDIEHASLETALREAAIAHKYEAMKRNVAIVVRCPEDMDLPMDRKRIFQVLSNLLSNAVRFAPEFTEILMRADVFDPRQVSVTVTDAGPGIDPLYHANIFKKFYQVKGQEHTNKGSSGIGLAICKGIVEAHGGAIWVNSQPAGGCTFGFTLPKVREG